MIETKLPLEEYGELFEPTTEEIAAMEAVTGFRYPFINSLLINNDGEYEKRVKKLESTFKSVSPSDEEKESYATEVRRALDSIPNIYSALLRRGMINGRNDRFQELYRGTSLREVRSYKVGDIIPNALSTSDDLNGSNWLSYALTENDNGTNPARMTIRIDARSRSCNV